MMSPIYAHLVTDNQVEARIMRSLVSKAAGAIAKWRTRASDALKPRPSNIRSIVSLSCSHPPETKISSPWLMIPTSGKEDKSTTKFPYDFYSLAEKRVISIPNYQDNHYSTNPWDDADAECIWSFHGWLAFISRTTDCIVFLFNPMSGRKINLPPITTLPIAPEDHDHPYLVTGIALSSSRPDTDEDCRVMIIYFRRETGKWELAFCSPGRRDTKWITLSTALDCYLYITYSSKDQLFFAMTYDFKVDSWDLRDPCCPKRVQITNIRIDKERSPWRTPAEYQPDNKEEFDFKPLYHNMTYLVPDDNVSGQLFWVDRLLEIEDVSDASYWLYNTRAFDVYKFDLNRKILWYMDECLDDSAIFIGKNQSLMLPAIDFPELKPNSIYFTDDFGPETAVSDSAGHDLGIYNYKDKTLEPCYYPRENTRIHPPPLWYTPPTNSFPFKK